MADRIRWGVLGTGNIAKQFARDLKLVEDGELMAVGSRRQATADAFGDEFDVPVRCDSYEALVERDDVDVVYISTPHPYHHANTLLCLDHGKAVLCEKPFAMNVRQTDEMIARARERNVFCMEAMWTSFLPSIQRMVELIRSGEIGEVKLFSADFCFTAAFDPASRLYDPALGGGALLDIGIYPISLAFLVFDESPAEVVSHVVKAPTGVDQQSSVVLAYPSGAHATITSSFQVKAPHEAVIGGTKGWIRIPRFSHPDQMVVGRERGEETLTFEIEGVGYGYEIREVHRCLRAGRLESEIHSLERTRQTHALMDRLRADWGLTYPDA